MSIRSGGGGGGQVTVEEDGTVTVDPAEVINFTGAGVSVTDAGNKQSDINISGGGGTQLSTRYPRI